MVDSDIIFAVVAGLVVLFMLFKRKGDISSEAAHELVDAGALLVDVRSPAEFGAGHIRGAINIPVQSLPQRLKELDDKERPLVLYCASGARSASAAGMLRSAGYKKVHNLGAKSRW